MIQNVVDELGMVPQMLRKGTGEIINQREDQDHSEHSIDEIC